MFAAATAAPVEAGGVTRSDDLVLHWKLDESSGTTASDSSGNGRDGTLTNMDGDTDWVDGKLSGGLDFDGSNDHVVGPTSPALGEKFTWTCWYKPAVVTGNRYLTIRYDLKIYLQALSASVFFYHKASGTKYAGSTSILSADEWFFFAAAYDSTAAVTRLILRWAEVGTHSEVQPENYTTSQPSAHDFTSTTSPFQTGRSSSTASGIVDDVRWYSDTLPDSDLNLIYNGGDGDL